MAVIMPTCSLNRWPRKPHPASPPCRRSDAATWQRLQHPRSEMLMTATDLVDRLAAHQTLGGAPREELVWLASHGSLRQLNAGEVLSAKGARVEGLFVVLSGRIAISVDRGAGPHMIMEWRG